MNFFVKERNLDDIIFVIEMPWRALRADENISFLKALKFSAHFISLQFMFLADFRHHNIHF